MSAPLVLVINLEGAEARLAHFAQQASAAGVAFERMVGVDGRRLSATELNSHCDPAAIYPLSPAELGCCLSHRRAWERIAASNAPWGVIFEDDAVLNDSTGDIIACLPNLSDEPMIVKLECSNGEPIALDPRAQPLAGRKLHALRGPAIGSAAYALTRAACARLLSEPPVYAVALDLYLFSQRHGAFSKAKTYALRPAPVIQSDRLPDVQMRIETTITERGKRLRPRPPFAKLVKREIYRLRERALQNGALRSVIEWG